ncbi:MAG: type II toxin-antitoxin system VapC family toxin [Proteobacteria bacterium]|nr:type II toxin-antitoxin system VapC family toxin [Pseudomonadota bacterium]
MIALDTNLLVRFLVGDNEQQAKKVYQLFKKTEVNKTELLIPLLVILELIWVLDSAYDIDRGDILESINDLLLMPIFKFEQRTVLQKFILSAQQNNYDLSDLLIAHSAKFQGSDKTITFDKKAAKHELFELFQ